MLFRELPNVRFCFWKIRAEEQAFKSVESKTKFGVNPSEIKIIMEDLSENHNGRSEWKTIPWEDPSGELCIGKIRMDNPSFERSEWKIRVRDSFL